MLPGIGLRHARNGGDPVNMLKLQLPKNRIQYLLQQAPKRFDAAILERGWEYYHKNLIAQVELKFGTLIYATVQNPERRACEVTIDIESFENSECSCPDDGMCAHIAALVFHLYAPYGRPELLLQELKQAVLQRSRMRAAAARTEKTETRVLAPEPVGPAAEWQRFFDQRFYGYSLSHQHSIDTFRDAAWESLNAFAQDWDEAVRGLYRLHVVLFMLRKIEHFYLDTKASYLSYHHETGSKQGAALCIEKLKETVEKLPDAVFQSRHSLWRETLAMLGEWALQGRESPIDWLFVYRFIWSHVPVAKWRLEESERLDALLAKEGASGRLHTVLTLARAHFDVLLGESTGELPKRLEKLTAKRPGDFFLYLQEAHQHGDALSLLRWLRWLKPAMATATHDEFRTLCQYWTDVVKHIDNDAEWVGVMEALLPRSYNYYTGYLLQTKRYRQWVDLQLANRISPLNLYAAELKDVEKNDPALLLPLFTQAVERSVLEKNRTSYKTAVKLLKKLHTYYKKLDREADWERYVNRLAVKFARLRAFQEELKRTGYAAQTLPFGAGTGDADGRIAQAEPDNGDGMGDQTKAGTD
ncbi:SWIM zinc finger family protein [Paenibacillus chartarius]|uniref:SWIM zinc finger family protein n=1 Tax=Paenibacillus chartarius TaxID=747481 RepID=A0ABV6DSC3_9BACL